MSKLTIGILAYNEASEIEATLDTLCRQSVFQTNARWGEPHIVLVANGCTDDTVQLCREWFDRTGFGRTAQFSIVDLEEAGKANAWNVLIHDAMHSDAEYIVVMDADVRPGHELVIEQCVSALEMSPAAVIVTPQLRKRFVDQGVASLIYKLIVKAASGTGAGKFHAIAGGLYCGRAHFLRGVTMPRGIVVEDGYLRAMVLTSALTHNDVFERIQHLPEAIVDYWPYISFSNIVRYETRQARGTAINALIFGDLAKLPPSPELRMDEVRHRNDEDPRWVTKIVAAAVQRDGNVIPWSYALRRLDALRWKTGFERVKSVLFLPLVLFDIWTWVIAERQLRSQFKEIQGAKIRN